jgi:hypothetical protein
MNDILTRTEKRKVKVFERTYINGFRQPPTIKEVGDGFFHGWGVAFEEFESGAGNYSVAIVEMEDGSILTPDPTDIQFTDKLYQDKCETCCYLYCPL